MLRRIGIVADDLTGAADTAVQFLRNGWNTELQLQPHPTRARVIAVTTDSRNLALADAAVTVAAAVRQLRDAGATHLYKKIDSTLRGQVAAEIDATLKSWSADGVAVVCPAFPGTGRTVMGGELRVSGVPVGETALARDPVTPVKESHIPTLLGATGIAAGGGEGAREFADRLTTSGRIVVVDACNEDDLQRLAEALALVGPHVIAVGSAGLARHLAC